MYQDMRGVMVKFPYVASPEMSLAQAEIYMKECDIRHLPMIENDQVVGLVSERDLLRYREDTRYRNLTLADVINRPPFVVSDTEPLESVLGIMAKNKYGSALVTNPNSQLIGIFTTTDALILLQNLISGEPKFFKEPGKVVQLKDVVAWN